MPDLHETINQFLEGSIASIGRDPVIESKSITANGTYTAPEGVDGYSPITVNVPTPTPVIESKSITANGTYTAPEGVDGYSPITVNVPLPQNVYLLKSVSNLPQPIASFSDGAVAPMMSLKVGIEPQQDLHGYDAPWVGGAGKNKFDANNAIWKKWILSSNAFKVASDSEQSISYTVSDETVSITTRSVYRGIGVVIESVNYDRVFSITNSNIGLVILYSGYEDDATIINSGSTSCLIPANTSGFIAIRVNSASTVSFNCQLESGSTATTFAPYSNICPISGHTEANVTVADDVEPPTVSNVYTIDLDGTRYGVDLDVINGIGREYKEYPSYNGETLIGPWISDRDVYAEGTTPTIGAQVVDMGDITTFNTIPTAVKSLRGVNNVWADTGDIKDAKYFSKED